MRNDEGTSTSKHRDFFAAPIRIHLTPESARSSAVRHGSSGECCSTVRWNRNPSACCTPVVICRQTSMQSNNTETEHPVLTQSNESQNARAPGKENAWVVVVSPNRLAPPPVGGARIHNRRVVLFCVSSATRGPAINLAAFRQFPETFGGDPADVETWGRFTRPALRSKMSIKRMTLPGSCRPTRVTT
jgi:hypothetical protein